MKRFKVLWLIAGLVFAFSFKAHAQVAMTIYDSTGKPITAANPFDITGDVELSEGIATETTLLLLQAATEIIEGYAKQLSDTVNSESHLNVDVRDISAGTQTNDVKITLDGEAVGVTGTLTGITYSDTMRYTTCADTSVWYECTLPETTITFTMHAREGYDVKVSKDSDGAQYWTCWAGESFPPSPAVREGYISGTYYVQSSDKANLVVEIWVRKED